MWAHSAYMERIKAGTVKTIMPTIRAACRLEKGVGGIVTVGDVEIDSCGALLVFFVVAMLKVL